jgi:hypothetical protein
MKSLFTQTLGRGLKQSLLGIQFLILIAVNTSFLLNCAINVEIKTTRPYSSYRVNDYIY